jgi:hypothetical protein
MINDGTGTGNKLKIDSSNRAHVLAVVEDIATNATALGNSFNVNTGVINLTSANESAVLYFKNNEDTTVHISAVAVGLGASTGGASTSTPKITVVRNPTGGTIVSGATDVDISSNRNFGSSRTLTADAYKGAEGNTLTGGADHLLFFQGSNGRLFATIDEELQKGDSIGVEITPQASNTSMDVYAALVLYKD